MSSDGKNDPLPVMARTDAQAWAQHMTEYMAQAAGITLTPSTVNPAFRPCTGRNGERADDDRYYLSYAVDSTVPLQQHPDAVRKIRDMLTGRNFDIKGYREETDGQPDALLDAYDPQGHYLVSAETGGGTDRWLEPAEEEEEEDQDSERTAKERFREQQARYRSLLGPSGRSLSFPNLG